MKIPEWLTKPAPWLFYSVIVAIMVVFYFSMADIGKATAIKIEVLYVTLFLLGEIRRHQKRRK